MRAASVFYRGMFNNEAVILPPKVIYKEDLTDSSFHEELKKFMSDTDILTDEVTADSQLYKNGDLVIVKVKDCDQLKVGLVHSILVKNVKVYFVCKVYTCTRNWLQFFESSSNEDNYSFVQSGDLVDYKPLIKRGTTRKFQFVLHHRVSFSYST